MLKKRLNSFKYAWSGIVILFKTQPNVKIHFFITIGVIAAGFWLSLSATEWCIIVFTIAMVFMAEAFNTALEFLTDLVSPDYHILARKAKDVAAGGVFLTAIGAAIIGILIFGPKLATFFQP